jgi:hypothetical protein
VDVIGSEIMEIVHADHQMVPELRLFFGKYVDVSNDGVYSQEFICPDGIKAATQRGQVIAAIDEEQVIGACRFYKKKTHEVSLYQFAIRERYRGLGVLIKMLEKTEAPGVTAKCPVNAQFNNYYRKTGWSLLKTENGFMHWRYSLSEVNSLPAP